MEIVASSNMIRKFRAIKEFEMDLGLSKTHEVKKEGAKGQSQQITIQIRDPFIKRYKLLTNSYLIKSGNIGSLDFYTDNSIGYDSFKIYEEDKEYVFEYKGASNIREYLSDILDKILSGEMAPNNLEMNMEEEMKFNFDKNLPQGEFLQKRNEMEEEMAKMGVSLKK